MAKRRGQLVCQHLEQISRKALEKHQEIITEFVGNRHGIYALYWKNKLCYVGLATNLKRRLKQHLRDRLAEKWDAFSVYLTVGDDKLREIEALTIRIADPQRNKQKGKFCRSDNLAPKFRRMVTGKHKRELEAMIGGKKRIKSKTPVAKKKVKHSPDRKATLAPYVTKPFKIRMKYKGKTYIARVRRDGTINYKGEIFTSPSLAGRAILKRTTNGWTTWKYQRAPGDWVKLTFLRK